LSLSPAKPPNQGREIHQILDSKPTPTRGHGHKQVLRHNTRPASGQRCQVPGGIAVVDPIFTPVVPMNDEVDNLSKLRMERMRYPNGTRYILGATCS
jgi:hypothetical protein